jgi:hypothetical protein
MSADDKRLLKTLQNIRKEFARAARRQQAASQHQANGGLFHRLVRWLGINRKPRLLASYESEQNQKSKLDAEMVLWTRAVARYTRALVYVGGVAAVIAGGTLWAIKGQLDEMRSGGSQTASLIEAAKSSAEAAKRSADIAERALVASNRPWVKVEPTAIGDIVYNVNGANFPIQYTLSNIGHAPATNVWIDARIAAPAIGVDGSYDPRSELLKEIASLKARPPVGFGVTLFPGEAISQTVTVSIGADELKRITQKVQFIFPTIFGAADYRIGFDDKAHDTGFMFRVGRSDAPRDVSKAKNRSPAAIFPDEGDVPASDVRLTRSPIDGDYAD